MRIPRIPIIIGGVIVVIVLVLLVSPGLRRVLGKGGNGITSTNIHGHARPFASFRSRNTGADIAFSDFVGSESCFKCHIEQYSLWRSSTHGRAGGDPGHVKIIARFDDQPLQFKEGVVIPTITENKDYVFLVRREDQPEQVVKVDGVVGGGHMEGGGTQSFFTRLPNGSMCLVPWDFNRTDDVWFVQLKDLRWVRTNETISLDNLANWPPNRVLGTENSVSNCQNCHGSQILVEHESEAGKYSTRYTTLQINCESCHGPGRRHIDLMETADLDTLADIGITVLSTATKDESLDKCFECHAVKASLSKNYLSGMPLAAHFALKFPILATAPYMPDGRIKSFGYQQNHLFSDCYINGSMTCVDCHDPHSTGSRDVWFEPLVGKFDDGQCISCHPSKAENREGHSYHQTDSPGNVCTSCHMPFLQHPLLGHDVRFARSDHVIPIPRPAFDDSLGIENACAQCDRDRDLAWQQQKYDEWYGKIKPHNPLLQNNMKADRISDIHEAAEILLNSDPYYPMAHVTGLYAFTDKFLKPDMKNLDSGIIERLKAFGDHTDLDVRSLALMALHLSAGHNEAVHNYLVLQASVNPDEETALRTRWAFAMDYMGMRFSMKRDYPSAVLSHQKSLEIKPGDSYTLVNLGNAYLNAGNRSDAIRSFDQALDVDPENASIYFKLAQIYSAMRRKGDAVKILKKGLKVDPNNQAAQRMLQRLQS